MARALGGHHNIDEDFAGGVTLRGLKTIVPSLYYANNVFDRRTARIFTHDPREFEI